jgi:NhaP-type Na+/H+ or K+/H+ antiporter
MAVGGWFGMERNRLASLLAGSIHFQLGSCDTIMFPEFWPYLIGLAPILFARSWQARIVAILFGLVSIGLGIYYIWSLQHNADIGRAFIGAFVVAPVSAVATYFVDKKYGRKV